MAQWELASRSWAAYDRALSAALECVRLVNDQQIPIPVAVPDEARQGIAGVARSVAIAVAVLAPRGCPHGRAAVLAVGLDLARIVHVVEDGLAAGRAAAPAVSVDRACLRLRWRGWIGSTGAQPLLILAVVSLSSMNTRPSRANAACTSEIVWACTTWG